ncbi:MAG: YncE family protein, partial [Myxococcota bacterium]
HVIVGEIPFADSVRPSALSSDGRLFHHVDGLNGFQVADVTRREVVATVEHRTPLGWFLVHPKAGWLGPSGLQRCHGLAIRPDQREIWSACGASVTIHGITGSSYPELARVALESKAYWLTFSPDGRWALVALSGANQVAVVDTKSRQVVAHLPAGAGPKRNLVIELDPGAGVRPGAPRY